MLLRATAEVRKRLLVRVEQLAERLAQTRHVEAPPRETERQHEDVPHLALRTQPDSRLAPVNLALQPRRRLEPRTGHRRVQRRLPQRPHEPLHRLVAAVVLPSSQLLEQNLGRVADLGRPSPQVLRVRGQQRVCPCRPLVRLPLRLPQTPPHGLAIEVQRTSNRPNRCTLARPDDESPPTGPVRSPRPPRASDARGRSSPFSSTSAPPLSYRGEESSVTTTGDYWVTGDSDPSSPSLGTTHFRGASLVRSRYRRQRHPQHYRDPSKSLDEPSSFSGVRARIRVLRVKVLMRGADRERAWACCATYAPSWNNLRLSATLGTLSSSNRTGRSRDCVTNWRATKTCTARTAACIVRTTAARLAGGGLGRLPGGRTPRPGRGVAPARRAGRRHRRRLPPVTRCIHPEARGGVLLGYVHAYVRAVLRDAHLEVRFTVPHEAYSDFDLLAPVDDAMRTWSSTSHSIPNRRRSRPFDGGSPATSTATSPVRAAADASARIAACQPTRPGTANDSNPSRCTSRTTGWSPVTTASRCGSSATRGPPSRRTSTTCTDPSRWRLPHSALAGRTSGGFLLPRGVCGVSIRTTEHGTWPIAGAVYSMTVMATVLASVHRWRRLCGADTAADDLSSARIEASWMGVDVSPSGATTKKRWLSPQKPFLLPIARLRLTAVPPARPDFAPVQRVPK